jgi:ERCC4-type nuclease
MTAELDAVASDLESVDPRLALAVDRVSDHIEEKISRHFPSFQDAFGAAKDKLSSKADRDTAAEVYNFIANDLGFKWMGQIK